VRARAHTHTVAAAAAAAAHPTVIKLCWNSHIARWQSACSESCI